MSNSQAKIVETAKADWLPRIDFILDAAVTDVWPLLLHWNKWIQDHLEESVSGGIDKVGEIRKVSKLDADGKVLGHFFSERVRLDPNRRIVSRILPLAEPTYGFESITGYTIFNLYSLEDKTLVSYETVAQMETSLMSQQEVDKRVAQTHIDTEREWYEKHVPALQKYLKK